MLPIFVSLYIDNIFSIFTLCFLPFVILKSIRDKKFEDNSKIILAFVIFSVLQSFSEFNEFSSKYILLFVNGFLVFSFLRQFMITVMLNGLLGGL